MNYYKLPHVGKIKAKKSDSIIIKKTRLSYVQFLLRHRLYNDREYDELKKEQSELNRAIYKMRGKTIVQKVKRKINKNPNPLGNGKLHYTWDRGYFRT